jgi:hypothetical protein
MLTPALSTARLHRLAAHLHALGPRPLAEYLAEIIGGADPLLRLERYCALDVDVVRRLGANRMPPSHRVGRPLRSAW